MAARFRRRTPRATNRARPRLSSRQQRGGGATHGEQGSRRLRGGGDRRLDRARAGDRRGGGGARRRGRRRQLRLQHRPRPRRPRAGSRRMAPRPSSCRATSPATTDCQRIAAAAAAVRPHRRALQQRRPDHLRRTTPTWTRSSAEDFARIYAVNVIGPFQMIRAARAPARGRAAAGRGGQHRLDRRRHRHRLVGALRRLQGRADHHDAVAGPRAGAEDPRQRDLPRLHRHALVRARPAGARRSTGCAKARRPRRRCSSPPSRRTSPAAALFFASPAARHITGETLLVDAGSHLGRASLAMR